MFTPKMTCFVCLILMGLLLAACGGGEAAPTAVPDTPTPQPANTATAVPPTDTPIPPTDTPIPPTPTPEPTATPDIAANFKSFTGEPERVTFRYPPDWELNIEEQTEDALIIILTSGKDVFDLLGADDFSQPAGFAIGEIRWVTFFGSDDPGLILADWVGQTELNTSSTSDMSFWQQDGAQFASQDFEIVNAEGDKLLLTAAVIVNGGRYGAFAYGTTAAGAAEYAGLAQAIFDSIQLVYVDPNTKPPD